MKKDFFCLLVVIGMMTTESLACAQERSETKSRVVLASDVKWQQLNPKRGDRSPQAATLWGDRNGEVPTGFLVKFVDGFSSPPHIHNVTYRGVVISGLVHNDDPNAKEMWMPKGSYWTQPAGEVHITSAKGTSTIAYIEIDSGPYLVLPTDQAFDRGERPINVERSNINWLDETNTTWIHPVEKTSKSSVKPMLAFLWGTFNGDGVNGTLVKLPAEFAGKIQCDGSRIQCVLIKGETQLKLDGKQKVESLTPGSYFMSTGDKVHQVNLNTNEGCLIYVRSKGRFRVVSESNKMTNPE